MAAALPTSAETPPTTSAPRIIARRSTLGLVRLGASFDFAIQPFPPHGKIWEESLVAEFPRVKQEKVQRLLNNFLRVTRRFDLILAAQRVSSQLFSTNSQTKSCFSEQQLCYASRVPDNLLVFWRETL